MMITSTTATTTVTTTTTATTTRFSWWIACMVALLTIVWPEHAFADNAKSSAAVDANVAATSPRATFALVIGSNQSVDTNLTPLRYADDDAARYLDLFRLLGARTYLLTRLDENTRRLHPQAAAEAMDPRKTSFDVAVAQLIADVTRASQRGVETTVYFVYAGHGNVQNGEGYITLEDLRITGADLAKTFARVPATRIHVIADACASYFLAYSRGPGGERRPIEGLGIAALAADPRIGLLLSTSSARESHEWDAFQSGVFSHEVRSGLYGAADADGDGQVSYREIAAFVSRANAQVPNERYRPDVHARAPRSRDGGSGGDMLLDLRRAAGRRLEIDGKHAGHYFLEDARGVRIADVHNAKGHTVKLVRPAPAGRAYLRRVDDDKEFIVDSNPEIVAVADLRAEEPRSAVRGAAHESFNALFALPFDQGCVNDYHLPPSDSPATSPPPPSSLTATTSSRKIVGIGILGAGGLALGTGAVFTISNVLLHDEVRSMNQVNAVEANNTIANRNVIAASCFIGGGVAVTAGTLLLMWADKSKPSTGRAAPAARTAGGGIGGGASSTGGFVTYGASF